MNDIIRDQLKKRYDAIEEAYEAMLAYAAQGTVTEAGSPAGTQVRALLTRAVDALSELPGLVADLMNEEHLEPAAAYEGFLTVLERDAHNALAVWRLVLAQPSIGSQLIDNANASIHVRMLLTDVFLIDEVLKAGSAPLKPA